MEYSYIAIGFLPYINFCLDIILFCLIIVIVYGYSYRDDSKLIIENNKLNTEINTLKEKIDALLPLLDNPPKK